jgi:hypothetical protein
LTTVAPVAIGEVVHEGLAAVAEERRLDRDDLDGLADRVDDQRGERLALQVLGHDQQRLAVGQHLLQQREEVGDGRDLVAVQQDEGVLEHGLHRLGVGDEVRREVALVELQPLGELQLRGERGALLDGDDAVLADRAQRLADQVADLLLAGGDRADLGDVLLVVDRDRLVLEELGDGLGGGGDALAQRHRVGAGGHVAQAGGHHGLGEHGGGGGAVARDVVGLGGDGLGELGAEVLERVLEVDLARDGDAVVGDGRPTELLVDHDVPPTRAEGHLDRVGQLVHPALERAAGGLVEADLLRHVLPLLVSVQTPPRWPTRSRDHRGGGLTELPAASVDDREHVARGEDQVLLAVVLDLGAAVLRVDDDVADAHIERDAVAVVVDPARSHGEDLALLGLLLRRVRDDDAGSGGGLRLAGLNDDLVLERLDVRHVDDLPYGCVLGCSVDGALRRRGCRNARAIGTLPMRVPTAQRPSASSVR